jgi:VWFA-related protein
MLAHVAAPQQATPPVFRAESEIVDVPVVVLGADDVPVADLQASEFRLFEDGRRQPIAFFLRGGDAREPASPEFDLSVAALVDNSHSMLGVLQRARQAITDFMKSLARARVRTIVSFGGELERWRFDPDRPEAVFAEILSRGGGRTFLHDALLAALGDLRQEPGRHAIVILTDGEDRGSAASLADSLAALRASRDVVYALSFSGHLSGENHERAMAAEGALREIARASGGAVFDGSSPRLSGRFEQIRAELESQYLLGFRPGEGRAGFRRLRVEVARPRLRVRHREGYLKPSPEKTGDFGPVSAARRGSLP